ncbi:hypothetical protein DIPPA_05461 [Diplonema papillatum]|nr:hypothetical protein DIPPA_05461 [Diplonema papillatum]
MGAPEATPADPHQWTAAQVASYLRSVNLADKYVKVFEEEEINGMVLLNLTKDELKGEPFDIKGFGPIKTVMGAIETLKEKAKTAAHPQTPAQASAEQPAAAAAAGPAQPQVAERVEGGGGGGGGSGGFAGSDGLNLAADMWLGGIPDVAKQHWGAMPPGPLPGNAQAAAVPIGMIFPMMPPPPVFANGFSIDHLPRYPAPSSGIRPVDDEYAHAPHPGAGGYPHHQQQHAPPGTHFPPLWQQNEAFRSAAPFPPPPAAAAAAAASPDHAARAAAPTAAALEDGVKQLSLRAPPEASGGPFHGTREVERGLGMPLILASKTKDELLDEILERDASPSAGPVILGNQGNSVAPLSNFSLGQPNDIWRSSELTDKKKPKNLPRAEPLGVPSELPRFVEVGVGTDLTMPPNNWLNEDARVHKAYNPGAITTPSREFKTSALTIAAGNITAHNEAEEDGGIDIIAPAENLRKLFIAPFEDNPQSLSLTVHKLGQSLVIESPTEDVSDPRRMMSKLLYYSILAEDQQIAKKPKADEAADVASPQSKASDHSDSTTGTDSRPLAEIAEKGLPISEHPPSTFYRNLKWHFQDLQILLGSDQLVMQQENGSEVALKLQDVEQPITRTDALEYWLDNVMNNVPQVAICYHRDGVTQGYQLINTQDIPTFRKEASFEPHIVQEYAGNVLHWLKENCTREAGSYILLREGRNRLQLYDISAMYENLDNQDKQASRSEAGTSSSRQLAISDAASAKKTARPFAYPVAMLCLRMGGCIAHTEQADKAVTLLNKALDLLPPDTEPVVKAQAHAYLATAEVARRRYAKGEAKEDPAAEKGKKGKPHPAQQQPSVAVEKKALECSKEELKKAVGVLRDHGLHFPEEVGLRERLIHCHIGLAVVSAAADDIGECLRWVTEAEGYIQQSRLADNSRRPKAIVGGQTPTPESEAAAGGEVPAASGTKAAAAEHKRGYPDEPYLVQAIARLLETLGDVHQALVMRLLSSSNEKPDLSELQAKLDSHLEKDSLKASFLRNCTPLSTVVDENVDRALMFYNLSLKHVAKLAESKCTPAGIEVTYSSQGELLMKLGKMYNLSATSLMRENRLSKAHQHLLQAKNWFEHVSEPAACVPMATALLNIGKLMQRMASADASKRAGVEFSPQEEKYFNEAISHYHAAANTLTPSKTANAGLYNDALTLSAKAQLHLGIRIKANLVKLSADATIDYEKRATDLFLSALKTFQTLRDEASEAETYAHVGQLSGIALQTDYGARKGAKKQDSAAKAELRLKSAEGYYNKAIDYYANKKDDCMYLKLKREVARLHLFQLSQSSLKEQHFKAAVRVVVSTKHWLTSAMKVFEKDADTFTAELSNLRTLITDTLKEGVMLYANSAPQTTPKRKLDKSAQARLNPLDQTKELYAKALDLGSKKLTNEDLVQIIESMGKLHLREA